MKKLLLMPRAFGWVICPVTGRHCHLNAIAAGPVPPMTISETALRTPVTDGKNIIVFHASQVNGVCLLNLHSILNKGLLSYSK